MRHSHIWRLVWSNADWRPATRWLYTCVARKGKAICYEAGYGVPR